MGINNSVPNGIFMLCDYRPIIMQYISCDSITSHRNTVLYIVIRTHNNIAATRNLIPEINETLYHIHTELQLKSSSCLRFRQFTAGGRLGPISVPICPSWVLCKVVDARVWLISELSLNFATNCCGLLKIPAVKSDVTMASGANLDTTLWTGTVGQSAGNRNGARASMATNVRPDKKTVKDGRNTFRIIWSNQHSFLNIFSALYHFDVS